MIKDEASSSQVHILGLKAFKYLDAAKFITLTFYFEMITDFQEVAKIVYRIPQIHHADSHGECNYSTISKQEN